MNYPNVYTGHNHEERAPGNNVVYFQASSCLNHSKALIGYRPQTECQGFSILIQIQKYPFSAHMPPKSQRAPEKMSFDCVRLIFWHFSKSDYLEISSPEQPFLLFHLFVPFICKLLCLKNKAAQETKIRNSLNWLNYHSTEASYYAWIQQLQYLGTFRSDKHKQHQFSFFQKVSIRKWPSLLSLLNN